MSKILKVSNVGDYIRYVGEQEQHPLVGIIDYGISGYSRLVRIIMNKALSLPHGTNKATSCDPSRRTYRQL